MKKNSTSVLQTPMPRREMLAWLGKGGIAAATLLALPGAAAQAKMVAGPLEPHGAKSLRELTARLAQAPRRRDFKSVPMILTAPDQWDYEALNLLRNYHGGPKQVWDNTDIASPWLNLMRNAANVQVWSFGHANFLAVSATHGTCHLALYQQHIWDKYDIPAMIGHKFKRNEFLDIPPAVKGLKAGDYNDPQGLFSLHANCIPLLMERGVVFLACHNAIWEFAHALLAKGHNPDHLSHGKVAAELTNHLIPGAVLTPGIVATIPELQLSGYEYIK